MVLPAAPASGVAAGYTRPWAVVPTLKSWLGLVRDGVSRARRLLRARRARAACFGAAQWAHWVRSIVLMALALTALGEVSSWDKVDQGQTRTGRPGATRPRDGSGREP